MSHEKIKEEFTRFIFVGLICTFVQYILLFILVELASVYAVTASAMAYILSAVVSYFLNYHFTFQVNNNHATTLIKFIFMVLLGFLANTVIFYFVFNHFMLPYLFTQIVATVLVLMQNFMLSKYWTFKTS